MRSFKSLFKAVKSIFQIRAARRSNPGKTRVLALFSVFIFSRKFTRFHAALKPIFRSLKPFQAFSSLFNLRARVFSFYMNTYSGVIVEGGGFDWAAAGRFPALSAPNPSYHGVSFTQAAGPAALVTYIRAVLLRDTGAAISPFNAFLLLQGLETLSLRVERHVENALRVVDFLVNHPKVERVNHPSLPENGYRPLYEKYFPRGGGSIFTFEIKGGAAEAQAFIDKLRIFSLLANVADVKSLAIHPASTTHSQMTPEELAQSGIRPNTIRLSIGTEHIDDILADLAAALEA